MGAVLLRVRLAARSLLRVTFCQTLEEILLWGGQFGLLPFYSRGRAKRLFDFHRFFGRQIGCLYG